MKIFIFVLVLVLSTACAHPLIDNEETRQDVLVIHSAVDGETDERLVPNVEENKNWVDVNGNDDLAKLVQPALDLDRNIQTIFNIQNFNGGTINTGLTLDKLSYSYSATCSGTQCTARTS